MLLITLRIILSLLFVAVWVGVGHVAQPGFDTDHGEKAAQPQAASLPLVDPPVNGGASSLIGRIQSRDELRGGLAPSQLSDEQPPTNESLGAWLRAHPDFQFLTDVSTR